MAYEGNSSNYVECLTSVASIKYNETIVRLDDLWGGKNYSNNERIVIMSLLAFNGDAQFSLSGSENDSLKATLSLMLYCTSIDLRPFEWRALIEFFTTPQQNQRNQRNQDNDDDCVSGGNCRFRSILCSYTSALIHVKYVFDVVGLCSLFDPPIPCYSSMLNYYEKFSSEENSFGDHEEFVRKIARDVGKVSHYDSPPSTPVQEQRYNKVTNPDDNTEPPPVTRMTV